MDADSGLPLDSVSARSYIKKIDDDWFESEMFSDSTGLFYGATGITGASGGKCPDLIITLSRSGYYSDTIVNPNGDTVRLKKQ